MDFDALERINLSIVDTEQRLARQLKILAWHSKDAVPEANCQFLLELLHESLAVLVERRRQIIR